jgi:hypothetical protein
MEKEIRQSARKKQKTEKLINNLWIKKYLNQKVSPWNSDTFNIYF